MNKHKIEVGQTLYRLNIGNSARRRKQELAPVEVVKVGRKYLTAGDPDLPEHCQCTYHLDTLLEKTDYSADSCLYLDPQKWEDEKESQKLVAALKDVFDTHNRWAGRIIPVEDLRAAAYALIEGYSHVSKS